MASEGVTLSEPVENYRRVIIYFEDSDGVWGSQEVMFGQGGEASTKASCLMTSRVTGLGWYVKSRGITLAGNSIKTQNTTAGYSTGEIANGRSTVTDVIKIRRVIGYRK